MTAETLCTCHDDPAPPAGARCRLCGRVAPGKPVHTCHARACARPVRPQLLMCARHWGQVPLTIQRAVYAAYREGQCDDMNPSKAWHRAADAAIGYVAVKDRQTLRIQEVQALRAWGYETSSDLAGELQVRRVP